MIIIVLTVFCLLLAGAFDGMAEMLKFHPSSFFKKFPNAKPEYWLPSLSWYNKWKDGDPTKGEKFWQSSRALVWTTDAYHLMRMIKNFLILSAIVFPIAFISWYMYIIMYLILYLAYTGGFSIMYDKIFK